VSAPTVIEDKIIIKTQNISIFFTLNILSFIIGLNLKILKKDVLELENIMIFMEFNDFFANFACYFPKKIMRLHK